MFTIVVSYVTLMLRFTIALGTKTVLLHQRCPCLNSSEEILHTLN